MKKILLTVGFVAFSLSAAEAGLFDKSSTFNGGADVSSRKFENLTVHGEARLKDVTCDNLKVNGALEFEDLKVKNRLFVSGAVEGREGKADRVEVNGSFEVKDFHCSSMKVRAAAELDDSSVAGSARISHVQAHNTTFKDLEARRAKLKKVTISGKAEVGSLQAYDSEINELTLQGKHAALDKTHVKSMSVESDGRVTLRGGSTIENITFENGQGEVVIIGNNGKVTGTLTGGKIVKR